MAGYLGRHSAVESAGVSAFSRADLLEPLIDGTARQIATLQEAMAALRREQRNYRVGARGERQIAARVQQVLVDFGCAGWHLLADRRWPGTRNANIDLLVVGPPGVLVLDAKTWAEPRIERGALWRGQADMRDEIDKVLRQADGVAQTLADVGLAPSAVKPLIVLVGRADAAADIGGVMVLGERALQRELVRMGARLDAAQIATVVAAVNELCPPATLTRARNTRTVAPATDNAVEPQALLESQEIWDAAVEAAMREPIKAWMTWLHPAQAHLITRRYSGPARVRGAAGTGKTVVALHRARELAKRPGAHVLMTSYVHTLPQVHESLFRRLAPDLTGRVEFRTVHSWAVRLLRLRGHPVGVAPDGGRRAFETAWAEVGLRGPLASSSLPASYWREEVESVIKGRGLLDVESYLNLVRVGRRAPLREEQRRAIWELRAAYDRELRSNGQLDWPDVVSLALTSVREEPVAPAYTAVIVDEVQDLTCTGLRLLHALVGDAPDGLLLVGDGQQSVYAGGFTLPETGVSVTGRATVLDRNYRNSVEILDASFDMVRSDVFDDLDDDPLPGARAVDVDRRGGQVVRFAGSGATAQQTEMLRALRFAAADGVRTGDMAVLVPDNRKARVWAAALRANGVHAVLLDGEYDGTTSDAVKVGTYQRAKGLEFACVFLPDYDRAVDRRANSNTDGSYAERAELQRRQLFVAMTRARDRLWLGSQHSHRSGVDTDDYPAA